MSTASRSASSRSAPATITPRELPRVTARSAASRPGPPPKQASARHGALEPIQARIDSSVARFHGASCRPSGSRNGQFICTAPHGTVWARFQASAAVESTTRASTASVGQPRSTLHRANPPSTSRCGIAWFAPHARSSGGRSAVSRSIGIPLAHASTAAGRRLATAVPLVVITGAAQPVAFAMPSAWNAAPRSSSATTTSRPLACAARASGVLREPGQTTTCRAPARTNSAMTRRAHRAFRFGASSKVIMRVRAQETASKDSILRAVSSHSASASLPCTIPAPPNATAWSPCTSALRIPTAKSLRLALTSPTAPA